MGVAAPTPHARLFSLWYLNNIELNESRRTKEPLRLNEVDRLTKEAREHARKLGQENWLEMCETFNEHTSLFKVWVLFNALPGETRTRQAVPYMTLEK